MDYTDVFRRLTVETALLVFFKSNGDIRIMLATRNLNTVALKWGFQGYALGAHDHRCNLDNGNLAVFDLMLGDSRAFNIKRLIDIQYAGEIKTEEELNKVIANFNNFKELYEKEKAKAEELSN